MTRDPTVTRDTLETVRHTSKLGSVSTLTASYFMRRFLDLEPFLLAPVSVKLCIGLENLIFVLKLFEQTLRKSENCFYMSTFALALLRLIALLSNLNQIFSPVHLSIISSYLRDTCKCSKSQLRISNFLVSS